MNKIYTLVFVATIFFCSQLHANHFVGSELSMKYIGGDTFRVMLTVYRNCNGIDFRDIMRVKIQGLNSSYVDTLELKRISIQDITPTCPSLASRCQSSTSSFPYGIQKHVFVDTVYLGNKGSCDYYLSIYETGRQYDIWNSTTFYNYLKINTCQSAPNSSPILEADPLFLSCEANCVQHYFYGYDEDGDSLVYLFAPALADSATSIPYNSPYSYDKPLYFNGFPNAGLPFNPPLCRGFHLDPVSGILQFRPMQAQISWIDVKVEEYRNGVKIGEMQRDWQAIIMNCTSTTPDTISISTGFQTSTFKTCPGDTFKLQFTITGFDITDSNAISWNHGIPDATVNITGDTVTKTFSLKWVPDSADAVKGNFSFTIKMKGDNCPLPDTKVKTVNVEVEPTPAANYSAVPQGCGDLLITGSNVTLLYEWTFDGNTQLTSNSTLHFNTGGNVPYTVRAFKNQCSQTFHDTASIPAYVPLEVSAGPDKYFCEGDSFSVKANVLSGNGGYHYLWLPGQVAGQTYTGAGSQSQQFIVEVTDTQGCVAHDTIFMTVRKLPKLHLLNLPQVCKDRDTLNLSPYGAPSSGTWSGPGVTGNKLVISQAKNGDYLKYTFTDTSGCTSTDSTSITINSLPSVNAGADSLLCIKNPQFILQGNPAGGAWSGNGVTIQGFNFLFDPQTAGVGQHDLIYNFTDHNNCNNSDTVRMTVDVLTPVDAGRDTTLCVSSPPVMLIGHPSGGNWTGTGVSGNSFDPAAALAGVHYLVYDYSGIQDCANRDSVRIIVYPLPSLTLPANTSLCINAPAMTLSANPPGGTWSGAGVQGNQFNPSAAGAGQHSVIYTYEDANHCANHDSITISVLPVLAIKATYQPLSPPFQVQFQMDSSLSLTQIEWDFGDGTFGNQRNPVHTYAPVNDSYTVIVKAMALNGCQVMDTIQVVIIMTGIKDYSWIQNVKVFPNPATKLLAIEATGVGLRHIVLRNALGQTVYENSNPGDYYTLDLKNIAPGIYLLELTNADNQTGWLKVVIQ